MVTHKGGFLFLFAFGVTASLAGCGDQPTTGPPPSAALGDHEQGDHEQGDHEHGDHEQGDHEQGDHEHGDHGHGTVGPHHGELIELGDEAYHGELLHDAQAGSITIYILDGNAHALVPVAEGAVTLNLMLDGSPSGFQLTAERTEKDPAGRASRFILTNKHVVDALDQEGARGQLRVIIGGKPFSGAIEHGGHAH